MTKDCTKPMLDKSKRKCFGCGEEGHEAGNCPHKDKKKKGGFRGNDRKGPRRGGGRNGSAHVLDQGGGTYWAMVVRPKGSDAFERVGQ